MATDVGKMDRLVFAVWALLLGTWIGTVGYNFVAATVLFNYVGKGVESSAVAGSIAGDIFELQGLFGLAVMVTSCTMMLYLGQRGLFGGRHRVVIGLLAAVLVLILVEMFWVTPTIHELRVELGQQFGSVSDAPEGNPLRQRFGMMHGVSAMRALGELVLGGGAFLLALVKYDPSPHS